MWKKILKSVFFSLGGEEINYLYSAAWLCISSWHVVSWSAPPDEHSHLQKKIHFMVKSVIHQNTFRTGNIETARAWHVKLIMKRSHLGLPVCLNKSMRKHIPTEKNLNANQHCINDSLCHVYCTEHGRYQLCVQHAKGLNKGLKCLPNMTPLKGGLMSEKYQSV